MGKNIYSLVLSDEVVAKAKELSYQKNTSCSNLINQILAEYFSLVTPEMRMQNIFSSMEAISKQFRILEQTSAHIFTMQSRLNYKYNPTIHYSVELFKNESEHFAGKLRIQLRTQNQQLIELLEQFFHFWIMMEQQYLHLDTEYLLSSGKLERTLRNPDTGENEFGELLGEYIRRFDRYLKDWFTEIPAEQMQHQFGEEIKKIRKFI